ncbi:MAG: hypothetical protein AAF809_08570 [Bacteroidota bacterium]
MLALVAACLVGCELAQDSPDAALLGPTVAAKGGQSNGGPLGDIAQDLNGSAQATAFYYDLQYAAADMNSTVLLGHFLPSADAEGVNVEEARAAFCADLGEEAEACQVLSEQADALAKEHDLDLVALGVGVTPSDRFAKASEGFDFAGRCPPPPEPRGTQTEIPTYYPNAFFGVDPSFADRSLPVLGLQFVPCRTCHSAASWLDVTLRTFVAIKKPRCPRTGCKCEPPTDGG